MNTIERIQNYYSRSLGIYNLSIDKLIDQLTEVYFQSPYLLIFLLASIPFSTFILISITKKIWTTFRSSSNLENEYVQLAISFAGWFFTSSIYQNISIALEKNFGSYEKILFIIASSIATSKLIIIFLEVFILNAKEQFKSNLNSHTKVLEKTFKKIKNITISCSVLMLTLNEAFSLEVLSFLIFIVFLYKLNKELKKLSEVNDSILNYLFNNIPSSLYKSLTGPLKIISLFIFLISAIFYRLVFTLSFFEITKKLTAKIIRQQVERISSTSIKAADIPENYIKEFSSLKLNEYRPKWLIEIEKSISHSISKWVENSNSVSFSHLVGDPGSGRLILIEDIKQKFSDLNPVTIKIENKITSSSQFQNFITAEKEKVNHDSKLIIIDNAENLYLNYPGNFEAIKELFNILNSNQDNYYFINIFDYYPWLHIKDFLGQVNSSEIFTLKGFSDKELSKLILDKNKKAKVKIIFDKAIYEATNKKGLKNKQDNVSTYYFRMIWEQTNGNPLMAQLLWLNSIRVFNNSEQKIIVGLPPKNPSSIFKNISLNSMFVYNTLLKHSRLTFDDCCKVTNLERRIVSGAVTFGKSQKFLSLDNNGHYYIKRSWYSTLSEVLKTKNLIHG